MLVILNKNKESYEWILKDINLVINLFSQGKIIVTNKRSFSISEFVKKLFTKRTASIISYYLG